MSKFKVLSAAFVACVLGVNVFVVKQDCVPLVCDLENVEAYGSATEWNSPFDWAFYGFRKDEKRVVYECTSNAGVTLELEYGISFKGMTASQKIRTIINSGRPYGVDCDPDGNENCESRSCIR